MLLRSLFPEYADGTLTLHLLISVAQIHDKLNRIFLQNPMGLETKPNGFESETQWVLG